MKMVYSYLFLLSFALFIVGCGQKPNEGILVINPDDALDVQFEDVAQNFRIVPLSSDEPLYGFGYIQSYGNELFAVDEAHENVYYFKDNKHEGTLSAIGRGPGEYISIQNILYDSDQKILYLLNLTTKDIVLKYKVPSMEYIGKLQMPTQVGGIRYYDDKTLLVALQEADNRGLYLYDIEPQQVKSKVCDITKLQFTNITSMIDGFDKNHHILALQYIDNRVSELTDDGIKDLLIFNYGKMGADPIYYQDAITMEDTERKLDYLFSNTEKFRGSYHCRSDRNGISFWYSTMMRDDEEYRYFRVNNGKQTHYRGFHIPGLKKNLLPSGITESGYVSFISGYAESLTDTSTAPSQLATQILDIISRQSEGNPVLVYFDIK